MKNQTAFTLIELLVVVTIIGILVAIAIPQFQQYRQRGYDASAKSDLRNAAAAEEAYFIDNEAYGTCANASACVSLLPGLVGQVSKTVQMAMTGTSTTYSGTATSTEGTGLELSWDSTKGGAQNF